MSIDSFCLDYSIAVGSPALFFSSSSLFLISCIVVSDFLSDFFLEFTPTIVVSPASRLIRKRCFLSFEFVSYFLWKVAICLGVLLIFLIFSFFLFSSRLFLFFRVTTRFFTTFYCLNFSVGNEGVISECFSGRFSIFFLLYSTFDTLVFFIFFESRYPILFLILPDFPQLSSIESLNQNNVKKLNK